MTNTIIDNSSESLSMVMTLKECFALPNIKSVKIASGYWDIQGLALLEEDIKAFLEREGTHLYLLIGKDPYIYAKQVKDPKYKDASYPKDFIKTDLNELEVTDEYVPAVKLLLEYCTEEEDSKIQIRIFRKNESEETQFLHSKCYIFDGIDNNIGIGIIGSSNFTKMGLEGNAELNYLEIDTHRVLGTTIIQNNKTHIQWFNEKWELSESWNKEFLEQILKPAPIIDIVPVDVKKPTKKPFTPYELYIKLLQHQFGDIVDKNISQQIEGYLPSYMKTLDYQIEAVKRCISIMHEHGGFMLADVVGLGKTVVGTLIIKRFLTVPEDDNRERKVLIVTPPAIKSAWVDTITKFDKEQQEKMAPCIDYITTGSINNLVDPIEASDFDEDPEEFSDDIEYKNYGLIIIDESHKFRNSETQMYRALDDLIMQIGANTGAFPYIGLLSATPQNNRPNDIKNQIYLFERDRNDSTLKKAEGGNIERFFSQANREYSELINGREGETPQEKLLREEKLKKLSLKIRDCVLEDILERRTRTDVIKYYANDIEAQGLVFPTISGPLSLKYVMDDELADLFSDTMILIAPTEEDKLITDNWLGYYRYRAIQYFTDVRNSEKYKGRGSLNPEKISNQLARIMQMLLVKRLESSFVAFTASLQNLKRYTENMIRMWENDTIFVCPQIDVNKELDEEYKSERRGKKVSFEDCANDLRKAIKRLDESGKNEKKQNAEYRRSDFKEEYIVQLKNDYKLISSLYDRWAKNSEDPKFDKFKEDLLPVLMNKETNTSGKLVIFSEAIDTVKSLERVVKNKGLKPLLITAANRDEMEQTIKANFDANYDGEQKDDYNVIITTDVLAEGVNLHRANVILNYDTPWNSTKLMQRIGRVNRIGSKEPCVYVYNFMPSAQGDAQIQLVRKAHTKLQSFHILFGEDSQIFSEEEKVAHYALNRAANGEESPMEKYVYELKQYKDAYPTRFAQIETENEGWEIVSQESGSAYFLIKAPQSASLAVEIDKEGSSNIISISSMIEAIKVDESTPAVTLPSNWEEISKSAILAYNQYFVRISRSRAGDKVNQAQNIIRKLYENKELSATSRKILEAAMVMVRRGNISIVKSLISIDKQLENAESYLFEMDQQTIDNILSERIGKLVSLVEKKQGEAEIIIGTCK